jgi:hypothetical protein
MAAPNRVNHNSSAQRFFLRPRTVEHYLHNFKISLEDFFNTQNPGQTEDYYLIGDFVVPQNRRKIIMYVAHEPLVTARKVSRIYFTLPVDPAYSNMFDHVVGPGETIPSMGPLLHTFDVPDEYTAATFVDAIIADVADGPEEGRLVSWQTEISRVRAVSETAGTTFLVRRTASKLTQFWSPLRTRIMDILHEVGINIPNEAGRLPSPWRSAAVAAAGIEGSVPNAPVRSSSSNRRRRSSQRRRRTTHRKTTTDPTNLKPKDFFNTDLVTGKRLRRRRPNSDPKDD